VSEEFALKMRDDEKKMETCKGEEDNDTAIVIHILARMLYVRIVALGVRSTRHLLVTTWFEVTAR
jgi:hypothetical protein